MYGFQLLLEQYSLPVYQIRSMIVTASLFVSARFVPCKVTKAGRCWWQKVPQMFHVIRSYFWCSENVLLLKRMLINGTTSKEPTCAAPFRFRSYWSSRVLKICDRVIRGVKHPLFNTYFLERESRSSCVCSKTEQVKEHSVYCVNISRLNSVAIFVLKGKLMGMFIF